MSLINHYGNKQNHFSHEELVERKKHCVCKQCGGELDVALIIYNKYGGSGEELYCTHCQKQEFGVERLVYQMAEYYVENFQFNYFYDMEENDVNFQLNVAKVADMISWIFKNVDLLDQNGLKEKIPDYEYYLSKRKKAKMFKQ